MKICLVSNEILGATKNGGIGTATSHLGVLLARNGHRVAILHANAAPPGQDRSWNRTYRTAGVKVTHLPTNDFPVIPAVMRTPSAIFEHLKNSDFDAILFQDFLALGHACVVAKSCGRAFSKTILATIAHGSTPWVLEAGQSFPHTPDHLTIAYMEQQAIELSDALISPSEYLLSWMRRAVWKLPENSSVIPYYLDPLESLHAAPRSRPKRVGRSSHLVFFGRLEERKGINLFLRALASERLKAFQFKLTFLGREASLSAADVQVAISQIRPDLLPELEIKADLEADAAQLFLTEHDCVAVIPSLLDNSPCVVYESLQLGVPFIASAAGGIPELIHPDDHGRCLFEPTPNALVAKLTEVLASNNWAPARPAHQLSQVAEAWLSWFSRVAEQPPEAAPRTVRRLSKPAVSIAITHYERPKLLAQCLRALSCQTDPDFDVIVVDDGSKSEQAEAFLQNIEGGFAGLRLKIVRQENRYLGAARNEALRRVTTPYVIFQDDDNVPFPIMVEAFRGAIETSQADIVTCQMQIFRDPSSEPDERLDKKERYAFPGGPVALGFVNNVFGDAGSIFRREIFDQVGCFHELRGVGYEDWDLHLRAVLHGRKLLSIPEPLFWYRITPNSMQHTTNSYRNMRMIASSIQSHVPPGLAPLVDLAIGRLRPEMAADCPPHRDHPEVGAAERERKLEERLALLEHEVDSIYRSRIWRGRSWAGGLLLRLRPDGPESEK
jgi:O-antigen biosynthesis protein